MPRPVTILTHRLGRTLRVYRRPVTMLASIPIVFISQLGWVDICSRWYPKPGRALVHILIPLGIVYPWGGYSKKSAHRLIVLLVTGSACFPLGKVLVCGPLSTPPVPNP